jgi:hypothetical protein
LLLLLLFAFVFSSHQSQVFNDKFTARDNTFTKYHSCIIS